MHRSLVPNINSMPPPDPHGQVALMLCESLLHVLVEEGVISHAKAIESIEGVAEILCEMAVRDREFQASRSTARQPHEHAAARVGLIEQLRESFIVKMEPPP